MHQEKNQAVPFEFDGAKDDSMVYRMIKNLTTPGKTIDGIAENAISVLITHPVDGDVFAAGKEVTIRAQLTGIKNSAEVDVQFFADDKVIGKLSSPPWEFVWKNPPVGVHNVMAIVRDRKGLKLLQSGLADFEVRSGGSEP